MGQPARRTRGVPAIEEVVPIVPLAFLATQSRRTLNNKER